MPKYYDNHIFDSFRGGGTFIMMRLNAFMSFKRIVVVHVAYVCMPPIQWECEMKLVNQYYYGFIFYQ